jgi:transposase
MPHANTLRLPHWTVIDTIHTKGGQQYIKAEYTAPPPHCLRCGVVNPKVSRYGSREQLFNDLQLLHKPTGVLVQRLRYLHRECGKTFMQELPDMDEGHRATKRLVDWVAEESLRSTFAYVAERSGFDERTVRRIFDERVSMLEAAVTFETPEWLGIDEVHLIKQARCVLANLKQRTVIDMLPDRAGKKRVTQALLDLPDRQRVELVTMDMTRAYRDAVAVAFPDAVVVVDKFHVVRMASDAMESIRRGVRKGLSSRQRVQLMHDRHKLLRRGRDLEPKDKMLIQTWFAAHPQLGEAYHVKEGFYELYDNAANPEDAMLRIDLWRATIPKSVKPAFKKLLTAISNWQTEILAYFDTKATNAPVEALNRGIKQMQSEGRGYSFRALRAKILYGKTHKTASTSIRSGLPQGLAGYIISAPQTLNYGVPFEALYTNREGHFDDSSES